MFNFLPVGHLVRQGGGFCSLSGLSTKGCAGEDKKDNGKNSEQSSALGCRASFRGRYVHDFFLWSGQEPLSGWATDRPKDLTLSREKQDVTARGKPLLIDDE